MKFGGQIRNIVVNFRSDRSLAKMAVIVIVAVFLYGLLQGTFAFIFCRGVIFSHNYKVASLWPFLCI